MILVCGCCDETGCEWFIAHLVKWNIDFTLIDERELGKSVFFKYTYTNGRLQGVIDYIHWQVDLSKITGVYNRTGMLDKISPKAIPYIQQLNFLLDNFEKPVFNKPKNCHTNYAKAIQYKSILEVGLKLPNSYLGNFKFRDPKTVEPYLGIVKSISSYRSKVKQVNSSNTIPHKGYSHFHQYQKKLKGKNIRVHVVGMDVHSVYADTNYLDYRYAPDYNETLKLVKYSLPKNIEKACVQLSKNLGLGLSGIDLFQESSTGDWYCFEINTSPGYSWFEKYSKVNITESLIKYLT